MERFSPRQKLTHIDALCGVDPHLDPHGETNGWNTWNKEFPTASFLRQKCPQSPTNQGLGGLLSLGKDEVGGSNPPSSSRKRPLFSRKAVFFLTIHNNFGQFKFSLLRLTTHLATDRKRSGLRGCFCLGGPFVQPVSSACFRCSFSAEISAFISAISRASFSSQSTSIWA